MSNNDKFGELLKEAASAISSVDSENLSGLDSLGELLDQIGENAREVTGLSEDAVNEVNEKAGEAGELVSGLLNKELEDVSAIIEEINGRISALQGLADSVCNVGQVEEAETETQGESVEAEQVEGEQAQQEEDVKGEVSEEEPAEAEDSSQDAEKDEGQTEDDLEPFEISEDDLPLVADFVTEAAEHIETAEGGLLDMENDPADSEAINLIFRGFHTIKGMAGFLNLTQIGSLAHSAENLLDMGRKGTIKLVGPNMDVVFESVDMLKNMIGALQKGIEAGGPIQPEKGVNKLIAKLKVCVEGGGEAEVEAEAVDLPSADVEPQGSEPEDAVAGDVEQQEAAGAESETTEESVEESGVETEDEQKGEIDQAEAEVVAEADNAEAEVEVSSDQVNEESDEKVDEILKPKSPEMSSGAAQEARKSPAKQTASDEKIKVSTSRLDNLINMVGELVIAQSMVSQSINADGLANHELLKKVSHQGKIVRELQELGMLMRMVPIQGVFQKMARLVRDLSRKSGKKIDFQTHGEETELDRIVVDQIADPLVHMVRNSVDHGVEDAEARKASGKNPVGRVELRAFHQGGNIVIQIVDDGKGLDKEKVLQKAIANGVVQEGAEMTDQDIYKLIFSAGLSTAEKVTDISGRGVGMDVVKKNIESLRGKIEIDSEVGKGTTFTIRLPLTMAIIDGQVVRVGSEQYIIPIVSITSCLRPTETDISTVQNRGEMVKAHGRLLPMVRLYDLFGVTPDSEAVLESAVVIVEEDGKQGGIVVDELLGQQQVVIKSLGEGVGRVKGVSGGAIMGDGRVSLILDIAGLMEAVRN